MDRANNSDKTDGSDNSDGSDDSDDSEEQSALAVQISEEGDNSLVVSLAGDLDVWTALSLRNELDRSVLRTGEKRAVALDLSRLDFIDSQGLKALVILCRRLQEQGRSLSFVGAKSQVLRAIHLIGLDIGA